jgi:hypothetical protein
VPTSDVTFDSSPQIKSGDAEEAADILSRVYLPLELRPVGAEPLDMHMRAEQLPMLTAGYLRFGTEVFIGGDEVPAYFIEAPVSGTAQNSWRDGRTERTAVGSAAVFTPGMPVDLNWSNDCRESASRCQKHRCARSSNQCWGDRYTGASPSRGR